MLTLPRYRIFLLALGATVLLGASLACVNYGVLCDANQTACGPSACVDTQTDIRNCGGCALACGSAQVCVKGQCQCEPGTVQCGGSCVSTNDPEFCGGCPTSGTVNCESNQVCEEGSCHDCDGGTCTCDNPADSLCGRSCVNLQADALNCGMCGNSCPPQQSCHAGQCRYDVILACITDGTIVGIQDGSLQQSSNTTLGSGPQSLGSFANTLLSLDGVDQHLYEADFVTLQQYKETPRVEKGANHMLVDGAYVYVVNSSTDTFEVLQQNGASAITFAPPDSGVKTGVLDGGLGLVPVAELALSANPYSFPESVAKLGNFAYVPMSGDGTVQEVNVTDPVHPTLARTFDLSTLNLHPLDGGSPSPTPSGVIIRGGMIYVTLANLNADFSVGGDGLIAIIDPSSGNLSEIDVGSSFLDAFWMAQSADGGVLYVSFSGRTHYDGPPHYESLGSTQQGVLAIGPSNTVVGSWTPCSGGAVLTGNCKYFSPSRIGLKDERLYVGDNAFGRYAVLQSDGGSLTERLGFGTGTDAPVACPTVGNDPVSNVADVFVTP